MMTVRNHGGQCCGIKHIEGFPGGPQSFVCAIPARKAYHSSAHLEMKAGSFFYGKKRPMEIGEERLVELLKYIDAQKSSHLVEVVLHSYIANAWKQTLEKYGFKEVSRFTNSNTHATLVVFHRITPLKQGE